MGNGLLCAGLSGEAVRELGICHGGGLGRGWWREGGDGGLCRVARWRGLTPDTADAAHGFVLRPDAHVLASNGRARVDAVVGTEYGAVSYVAR